MVINQICSLLFVQFFYLLFRLNLRFFFEIQKKICSKRYKKENKNSKKLTNGLKNGRIKDFNAGGLLRLFIVNIPIYYISRSVFAMVDLFMFEYFNLVKEHPIPDTIYIFC